MSPSALRFLKQSFNAETEHMAGVGQLAFSGLHLFSETEEAREGVAAFNEKRDRRLRRVPRRRVVLISLAPGQSEDPLGDDVLLDLRGAACERHAAGEQRPSLPARRGPQIALVGQPPFRPRTRARVGEVGQQRHDEQLADRGFGPRRLVGRQAADGAEAGQPVSVTRACKSATRRRTTGSAAGATPSGPASLTSASELVEPALHVEPSHRDRGALVLQRGSRDRPARADFAEHAVVGRRTRLRGRPR